MKFQVFVRLVARNSVRNRRRTVLTLLSVSLSFFLICTLRTVLDKLETPTQFPNSGRRAVVRNATSLGMTLPISYRDRIRQVPGVTAASAAQWFGGVYRDPSIFFAQYAVDANHLFDIYPETRTESPEQENEFIHNRTASLAGTLLRDRFGWRVGDRITLKGVGIPVDVETTIAGFVAGGGNDGNFYFHWDYLNELFPVNAAQTIFLIAQDSSELPAISEAVDTMFANSSAPTRTEAESGFILQLISMWGSVRSLVAAISSAVLLTLILIASNTMAMSTRERIAEMALLRTLGFTPITIIGILIGESSLICVAGALLGSVGSRYLYRAVDLASMTSGLIQNFDVRWQTVFVCASVSLLVAVVSALAPACTASRVPIASAVRQGV